ncbi:MAG: hypothetical protein AAF629_34725 [Chloroflexota bacterium]
MTKLIDAQMHLTTVSTVIGTGVPGYSEQQINNPFGVIIGPDGGLYFCDLDNQCIRRLDLATGQTTSVAGNGALGYDGDGGLAIEASLNMPHEIQFDAMGNLFIVERDNHAVRKVDAQTGLISTFVGNGKPGFSGDDGPANQAQLNQPHSIILDPQGHLLICDIKNHRIRRVDALSGLIETYAGTGEQGPTPNDSPLKGTPLNGPRTMTVDGEGNLYLALREGNAIYKINAATQTLHHIAGTGEQGYTGDGSDARQATLAGPKGLVYAPSEDLYIVDTENHVIRRVDLETNIITTVLGTGEAGDGPEPDPLVCKLARPHGIFVADNGGIYVGDSEAHRIRLLSRGKMS